MHQEPGPAVGGLHNKGRTAGPIGLLFFRMKLPGTCLNPLPGLAVSRIATVAAIFGQVFDM